MGIAGDSIKRVPLQLSDNAITVLTRRYLVKDEQGKPAETPEGLFWRVAHTAADPTRGTGQAPGPSKPSRRPSTR